MNIEEPVLSLLKLNKQYGEGCGDCRNNSESLKGNYCVKCHTVYAARNISFDLYHGETIGIVGESGSGKSTVMQSLYFDQEPTGGEYFLSGMGDLPETNLFKVSSQKQRRIRNEHLGMVYQNPVIGLKMTLSALSNIAEKMIVAGQRNVSKMKGKGLSLLDEVAIPKYRSTDIPDHFSGGMQQRVQIAKALSTNPPILLLDEVTTGLDLSVQADVLELIKALRREWNISVVLVSHDLAVVRMLADRTLVMLNGEVIEEGLTDQVLEDPQHEYTQKLVYSLL